MFGWQFNYYSSVAGISGKFGGKDEPWIMHKPLKIRGKFIYDKDSGMFFFFRDVMKLSDGAAENLPPFAQDMKKLYFKGDVIEEQQGALEDEWMNVGLMKNCCGLV